ncbi:DUF4194 domain-containing protein [Serratia liquefaciens]|uniref:DUF4194 domain-containing protein n=1 Tax=Serratia liquefaciens TaxID=614 RepID=UPI0003584507|nr:DUF4194 domain-containing protein [Serratia liquefaciens]AGQ30698.1 hypothetical protein M495_09675 [Serratia liquefaciens ATCC 27592]CAI0863953.1 Uncharacterised protein [Serratia liquefaciens]CAI2129411.1 Uncharacterised protein [Serratia liquefaciens]CAI2484164.1 Uncharacterised protein [Serratia liquefaciens]HCR64336.1 DUF4194 domain-containing protein [Serratia liquefaciens]
MTSEIALRELKDIEAKTSADYADSLRNTAAYLLQKQWVWKGKRGQKEHFKLCEDNLAYFNKLFDGLDMGWYYDRNFGYAGILPRGSGKQLDITSTLFLLILRKMYDAEASMGRTELGCVTPPTVELLNQYEHVRGEMPPITETNNALENLRKKGIIELGIKDPDTKLHELTVLPNITRVVDQTYVGMLNRFMDSYTPESASGEAVYEGTDDLETLEVYDDSAE